MPTSITTAPGLTQSASTIRGRPTAAIRTSARAHTAGEVARARVADRDRRVGGQQQLRHRLAEQVRAADDDRLGALELDVRRSPAAPSRRSACTAAGPGRPSASRPAEQRRQPVDVLGRRRPAPVSSTPSRCVGQRQLDEHAADARVGVQRARSASTTSASLGVGRQAHGRRSASRSPRTARCLHADVDGARRVLADEHRREPGRAPVRGDERRDVRRRARRAARAATALAVDARGALTGASPARLGEQPALGAVGGEAHDDDAVAARRRSRRPRRRRRARRPRRCGRRARGRGRRARGARRRGRRPDPGAPLADAGRRARRRRARAGAERVVARVGQLGRDLVEEAAAQAVALGAEQRAAARVGQRQRRASRA